MIMEDFDRVVTQHYESLYMFAFSLTRAEADALDLNQQTFYVWATKGHQLRESAKTKAWLFTTLHRAFLETRRKQTRFPHHHFDEVQLEDILAVSVNFANDADSTEVMLALSKVDEVYQAAVALFYLEDCSYNQIAEILAVPLGTVRSRPARGIMQLREILGLVESDSPELTQV